jgi:hypothetical protein
MSPSPSLMRTSSFLHRKRSISRLLLTLFCYVALQKHTIGRAISHSRMQTTAPWRARPTTVTFCSRTALYTIPMFAFSMPDTTRIIHSALVSSVSRSTIVEVVHRLCTEHTTVTANTILDSIDGMTCDACHLPPDPDFC